MIACKTNIKAKSYSVEEILPFCHIFVPPNFNNFQPPSTTFNHFNHLQLLSTTFNNFQQLSTTFNNFQPPSTTFNHLQHLQPLQPPSTTFNHFNHFNHFNNFQPLSMRTLVFATNNAHKAREIEQILGPDFEVRTLRDIGCQEDIEETEDTLEGNALLKARYVRDRYGYDCFSEDTGLFVDALAGDPGVHTARYAGEGRSADANIDLLLKNLGDTDHRAARFRTIIALVEKDRVLLLEGICEGRIARQRQGAGGFGYDPIFIPEGYDQSFAELGDAVKNRISHRGRATVKLMEALGISPDGQPD